MRTSAWVRRILTLVVMIVFALGMLAGPALAKSSTKSSGGFSSGSRSFSTPKSSTPSSPSRSYSTPKSTPAPSTTPKSTSPSTPSPSYSSPSRSYSSPTSPSYSSGDRSYSSPDRSYSIPYPKAPSKSPSPAPSYDTGKTQYPTQPPIVVYGQPDRDPTYWHDYYYGMPWYWRMWHRPVYYSGSGWGASWWTYGAIGVGIWVLLGFISAANARRRRHR